MCLSYYSYLSKKNSRKSCNNSSRPQITLSFYRPFCVSTNEEFRLPKNKNQ